MHVNGFNIQYMSELIIDQKCPFSWFLANLQCIADLMLAMAHVFCFCLYVSMFAYKYVARQQNSAKIHQYRIKHS